MRGCDGETHSLEDIGSCTQAYDLSDIVLGAVVVRVSLIYTCLQVLTLSVHNVSDIGYFKCFTRISLFIFSAFLIAISKYAIGLGNKSTKKQLTTNVMVTMLEYMYFSIYLGLLLNFQM